MALQNLFGELALDQTLKDIRDRVLSVARVSSAATTNATSAKASAAKFYGFHLANLSDVPVFLKLYNKASAPTVGTDVPVLVIPVLPGQQATRDYSFPVNFTTGFAYAITAGALDTDTTAVQPQALIGHLTYL